MINVEFPINEKYRKYLKIEYLFNQYHFFIKQKHTDHITNILFLPVGIHLTLFDLDLVIS